MTNYEILELMWEGYIAMQKEAGLDEGLPYGWLDISEAEADEWMDKIQNDSARLSSYLNDEGFYQPIVN